MLRVDNEESNPKYSHILYIYSRSDHGEDQQNKDLSLHDPFKPTHLHTPIALQYSNGCRLNHIEFAVSLHQPFHLALGTENMYGWFGGLCRHFCASRDVNYFSIKLENRPGLYMKTIMVYRVLDPLMCDLPCAMMERFIALESSYH